MLYADWLRQLHVAMSVGFRPLQRVWICGSYLNPVTPWKAVVYATHNKSRIACVARASDGKATTVGFRSMRHIPEPFTDDLKKQFDDLMKLRHQLGKWAPPIQGWED